MDKAPTNPFTLTELSDAYIGLAMLQSQQKELERAVASCRQVVTLRRRLVETYPAAPKYRYWLSTAEYQLGVFLGQARQRAEAAEAYARAADIQDKLVADQPEVVANRVALAATYGQQGLLCATGNDVAGAVAAFTREHRVRRKLADGHPDVADYQLELAHAGRKLGDFLLIARQPADANATLRSAADVLERQLPRLTAERAPRWRTELVQSLTSLGKACTQLNKLDDAAAVLARALPPLEQLTAAPAATANMARADLAQAFLNLAEEYRKARNVESGADAYRQAAKLAARWQARTRRRPNTSKPGSSAA